MCVLQWWLSQENSNMWKIFHRYFSHDRPIEEQFNVQCTWCGYIWVTISFWNCIVQDKHGSFIPGWFFLLTCSGQAPRSPTSPSFNIPSGYSTLVSRSTSLQFKNRAIRPSSASLSIPNSPEQDVAAFLENQFSNLDSKSSPSRYSQSATGMGNVPVIGYGGRPPPKKVSIVEPNCWWLL